jgi:hypothetical protein
VIGFKRHMVTHNDWGEQERRVRRRVLDAVRGHIRLRKVRLVWRLGWQMGRVEIGCVLFLAWGCQLAKGPFG